MTSLAEENAKVWGIEEKMSVEVGDVINTTKSCKKMTKGESLEARSLLNTKIAQQRVRPVCITPGSREMVVDHVQKIMKTHWTEYQYCTNKLIGNDTS